MKLIVIHIGNILRYPPVISLLSALEKKKIETVVITTKSDYNNTPFKYVKFKVLDVDYEGVENPVVKLLNIFKYKPIIEKYIQESYSEETCIWITYNVSLKHMYINRLKSRNYVLQLMELTETLGLYEKLPIKFNASLIAHNALQVVVPEYNRAHITKAWWDLEELPSVLPNKPVYENNYIKNNKVDDLYATEVIEKLKDKKIILYQGILTKERPIEKFICAVDTLGDEYAFVVMSSGKNIYANIGVSNYYFIPFVKPPLHLQITSHAYIGVLTYIPIESEFSKLNALYCAPNKVFEYGMFGIPMLGNDLPALKYLFNTEDCGKCFDDFSEVDIIKAIRSIESDYEKYAKGSKRYYDSVDYEQCVEDILNKVYRKLRENN